MKHVFIINPKAGKGDGVSRIYDMAERLRVKHGLDCTCMLTQSVGHATELVRNLAETGEEYRFYACGGDGTINEVACGAAGFPNAAMTAIPIGTGNDFLKNFGADAEKFSDAENLFDGEVQRRETNERRILVLEPCAEVSEFGGMFTGAEGHPTRVVLGRQLRREPQESEPRRQRDSGRLVFLQPGDLRLQNTHLDRL